MLQRQPAATASATWLGYSPNFVAGAAITALTLITYANVLSSFYLWADESWTFGTYLPRTDLGEEIWAATLTWGRPIGMFIQWLQAIVVEADLNLLILNRIASLAAVGVISYLICRELPQTELAKKNLGWLPLCVGLYLVLLPAAQVHASFSILLGSSLGMILAFLSYRWLDRPLGWIATGCALLLCLMTYQPSAFFIFVAFAADLWRQQEQGQGSVRTFVLRRGLLLVSVVVVSALIFSLTFKAIASGTEGQLYDRAKPLVSLMNGDTEPFMAMLERAAYGLNVFEIWSYPQYVPYIWFRRFALYLVFLVALAAANYFAIVSPEDRGLRTQRLWTTLGFAAAFLATLPPIIADGFSERQNLYYPAQGILVLNIAYAISCFTSTTARMPRRVLTTIAVVIALQSYMASSGIMTSIIRPQFLAIDYVATKLHDSGIPQGSKIAIAISLSRTNVDCLYEPCLAFYGRRFNADFEFTQAGFYERVAQRFGYEVVKFGYADKPTDPRTLGLGEPLVVIDLDEMRAVYRADRVQM